MLHQPARETIRRYMEDHGGMRLADTTMRGLLAGRKVSLKGFTSRKGSGFDAAILIDKDKGIAFDFNDNKERKRK